MCSEVRQIKTNHHWFFVCFPPSFTSGEIPGLAACVAAQSGVGVGIKGKRSAGQELSPAATAPLGQAQQNPRQAATFACQDTKETQPVPTFSPCPVSRNTYLGAVQGLNRPFGLCDGVRKKAENW